MMIRLGNNSKIIFRGMNLSGGAPKSAFEYLKVLKQDGCNVTAIACCKEEVVSNLYMTSFDRFISAEYIYDCFEKRRFIRLYRLMKKEYRMLKNERADAVFVLGYFNMFFYGAFCNSLGIPSIMMIAGGDLTGNEMLLKEALCDGVICFSYENREALEKFIDKEKISVISNRIELKKTFDDNPKHYALNESSVINVLLTSRVSSDKYASIINFIKTVNNVACAKRKIKLTVAGGGDALSKLRVEAENIKNDFCDIDIKGHVDDLIPEFEKAHIVVGKGRSVIEPMMMNRIGCVIGDDGKIEICSKVNFDRIYCYNFSGRHLECDNPRETLSDLIDSVLNGTYNSAQIREYAQHLKQYYSVEFLPEKLHRVLDGLNVYEQKKKHISVAMLVLKLIWYKLKQRKANQK